MSHHYSGPDFGFPHGDARLDFADLYAFPSGSPFIMVFCSRLFGTPLSMLGSSPLVKH